MDEFKYLIRSIIERVKSLFIDLYNRYKFGDNAPKYCERIWVSLNKDLITIGKGPHYRGKVIDQWPPDLVDNVNTKISEIEPIKSCLLHWEKGVEWKDKILIERMVGLIEKRGEVDGCKSKDDIMRRYEKLDIIYNNIKREKRIKTRKELFKYNFREYGGINFHIGPNGKPYFGQIGQHRVAIALALGIEKIPAELGGVHINGIEMLKLYRTGENK